MVKIPGRLSEPIFKPLLAMGILLAAQDRSPDATRIAVI